MLYDVYKKSDQIPESLGEAFSRFTNGYTNYKIDQEGIPVSPEDLKYWNLLLEYLAFEMLRSPDPHDPGLIISESEAASKLTRYLRTNAIDPIQAQVLFRNLLKYHLLQKSNKDEVSFCHQLIQEYYAAQYLRQHLSGLTNEQLKRDYLNYLKWTEAIALMLAFVEQKKQALRVVELALEVDLMLGARLAGAVIFKHQISSVALINNVKISKASRVLFLQRKHLIKVPDWLKVALLEETQSVETFPFLRKLLKSLEPSVRASTAYAIGRLGDKDAELDLIELQKDPDSHVRHAAKSALWNIESEEVAPKFFFKERPELLGLRNGRTQARTTLEESQKEEIQLERDRYLADLRRSLDSSESELRRNAVIEIGRQNFSEALPQLLELVRDPDIWVRRNVVRVLGKLGNANTAPKLLELIGDSDSDVVEETCEALGKLGNKVAILALIHVLEENPAFRVRQSAAKALGKLSDERAIPCLTISLEKDDSPYVRWEIAQSLANLGDFRAIPLLSAGLTESSRDIRIEAIKSLAKLKSPETQVPALKALKDPDIVVRDIATKIMIEIGDKRAILQIASLLKDSNLDVGWTAGEILKKVDISLTAELLSRLTKLLPSDSGRQAFVVIRAIQPRCKYYNHKIWQEAIQSQEQAHSSRHITHPSPSDLLSKIDQATQQIDRRTQQMADQPKYHFPNAQKVQIFERVGTYNENNYLTDSDTEAAIADLQTLLTQLQTQHPQVTTEPQALAIIDAEFTEIKRSNPHRLVTLRQQLLNPERHLQATKAAFGEFAKHYLEESVWAKMIITYLDKLSEEPNHGA
jgi:HEAT repeat protein